MTCGLWDVDSVTEVTVSQRSLVLSSLSPHSNAGLTRGGGGL